MEGLAALFFLRFQYWTCEGFGGGGIYLGFIFAVYQKYSALYSGVSLQMARHLRWGLLLHVHMARGDAGRPIWMSGLYLHIRLHLAPLSASV